MKCVTRTLDARSQSRRRSSARRASIPAQSPSKPGDREVLLAEVPGITHGRVAVAHVHLPGSRPHAFGHRMRTRNDRVEGRDVERLDRLRKQRRERPEMPPGPRQVLQKTRGRSLSEQPRAQCVGEEIDEREKVRLRLQAHDFRQHVLAAAPTFQPVVNDRNASQTHGRSALRSSVAARPMPSAVWSARVFHDEWAAQASCRIARRSPRPRENS